MFDVVQDNVIEKVVNNRNENVYLFRYNNKIFLIFKITNLFILKDLQGICDDLLMTSMRCKWLFNKIITAKTLGPAFLHYGIVTSDSSGQYDFDRYNVTSRHPISNFNYVSM